MDLNFTSLSLKLNFKCIPRNFNIVPCSFGDLPVVVANHGKFTQLIHFTDGDTPSCSCSIESSEECKSIVAMAGSIYSITHDNSIYRLQSPANLGTASQFVWEKVHLTLPSVVCASGCSAGLAAIVHDQGIWYLNIYGLSSVSPFKKYSKPLVDKLHLSDSGFYLKEIKLGDAFRKSLFSDTYLLFRDMLLIVLPSGWVSVLPLICEQQKTDPQKLHYENDKLINAFVFSENTLILIYAAGKIVQITFDLISQKLDYFYHYLPSKITTAIICDDCSDITFIYSDFSQLQMAKIIDNKLKFYHGKCLPGVEYLIGVNNYLLACTVNCAFYKLTVAKNGVYEVPDLNSLWLQLTDISKDVELTNSELYAIESIQKSEGQLNATLNKETVIIYNASSRKFLQCFWSVHIDSVKSNIMVAETHPLERDLLPTASISILLSNLFLKNSQQLKVSLVCNISSDTPNRSLHIASISTKTPNPDTTIITAVDKITKLYRK